MDLDGVLLCASACAYNISGATGLYTPDGFYAPLVDFLQTPGDKPQNPQAISARFQIRDAVGAEKDDQLINACLVGYTASQVIVAFRGTLPASTPDGKIDWFEDFLVEPVHHDPLPGKVHDGFYSAVMSIIEPIKRALHALTADQKALKLYVTGHSKGGGMAPIAAYLLHEAGFAIEQVVTFAGPHPGDQAFKEGYETVFTNHLRYENYGDLIPLLPPEDGFTAKIAEIASLLDKDLGKFIAETAGKWDYIAVGREKFISYSYLWETYSIVDDESATDQLIDVGIYLAADTADGIDLGTAIRNAHTLACGEGYMSGVCPDVPCPPPGTDVAKVL